MYFEEDYEENLLVKVWHIGNLIWTTMRLWPMDEHNFRVSQAGSYEPLLTNPTYVLIHKKYAVIFDTLKDQVQLKPAIIHDFKLKTQTHNYMSLHVVNLISPDIIHTADASGDKIWTCQGALFVSASLKNKIGEIGVDELAFSPGFSEFG